MTATLAPITHVASLVDVDVDSVDPALSQRLIGLGVRPNDMTSNQFVVGDALALDSTRPLLLQAIASSKGSNTMTILDRISVLLCLQNLPNISGRALLQASPSFAYDTTATVQHARSYAAEFEAVGVSRDRFAIKIMTTGPGMLAARILEAEGIRTLGTGLFSVPQALAAAQAGCMYISPYFNEILAHFAVPGTLPTYKSILDHPMAPRMAQIYEAYRLRGGEAPLIKSASFVAVEEVLAMPELGAQQVTVLAPTLALMCEPQALSTSSSFRPAKDYSAALPEATQRLLAIDPLRPDGVAEKPDLEVDYLADNGAALEAAIAEDAETSRRLGDAIATFIKAETTAIKFIEGLVDA